MPSPYPTPTPDTPTSDTFLAPATLQDAQDHAAIAFALRLKLYEFVLPLLQDLDQAIDRRLVRTFLCTLEAVTRWRNRAHGLLLSELGAYLMTPEHAPAGTKRLSNLLHCHKWTARIIDDFLWKQAVARQRQIGESQETTMILWDESVLEKAESTHAEGLCPVRSSKAKRLTRIKPGFFSPPTFNPIFVPGLHWISLLLIGSTGAPSVLAMRWWTSRGPLAQEKRALQIGLLERCMASFGADTLHVFDRGYAGSPWVEELCQRGARFLMRWPGRYKLIAGNDALWQPRSASELVRGKRSMDHRLVWDARQHGESKRGIVFLPVWTPDTRHRLWLVVCRRENAEPWYLVTSDPITTVDQAWSLVFAYARRWQIEMCWRYSKSELAMESPRLWHWEEREKLLLMVTLVYAFLLSLLAGELQAMREWLLRHYCHRTGKRSRQRAAPLYRLRSALSGLWNLTAERSYRTTQAQPQNSG